MEKFHAKVKNEAIIFASIKPKVNHDERINKKNRFIPKPTRLTRKTRNISFCFVNLAVESNKNVMPM